MGIRGNIAKSTLADANEIRDWHVYADFPQHLVGFNRKLYHTELMTVELAKTVYALDATTIDLCLSVFPCAHFHLAKAAVKMHTP